MGQNLKVSSFCAWAEQKRLSVMWLLKDACKVFQEGLWADKHPELGILDLRQEAGHTSLKFYQQNRQSWGTMFQAPPPPHTHTCNTHLSWWSKQKAPSSSCFQGKHIWPEGSHPQVFSFKDVQEKWQTVELGRNMHYALAVASHQNAFLLCPWVWNRGLGSDRGSASY